MLISQKKTGIMTFFCEKEDSSAANGSKPVHATKYLFSCYPVEIAELFLFFGFHCKFMCIDQKPIWPWLCGLRLLSRPVDLIRATLLVVWEE